jgi:ATP-dependent protease ClpP protease subunit
MKWLFIFLSFVGCSVAHAEPTTGVRSELHCYIISGKKVCDLLIKFAGAIGATSADDVASLLDFDARAELLLFKTLNINSPGGNLDAAMAIGRLLRKNRVSILIPKDGECVSACVMIYAGAVSRSGGKIGIHRPYLNQSIGSQLQAPDKLRSNYEQMLQTLRAYLRDMNVSERLAEDMMKIAPADVRHLSDDDLNGYGLTSIDPIEQETIDLQEAQSMGLDRQEHIRRQALANAKCGALKLDFNALFTCRETVMKSGR